MKKWLIVFFITILVSGCIEKVSIPGQPESTNTTIDSAPNATLVPGIPDNTSNNIPDIIATKTPSSASNNVTPVNPLTKYEKFVSWLETDTTNKHSYTVDNSKSYQDQYVCSQFTKDFIKNATDAGFEVYAVGLTGAVKGQNDWHMLASVVLDKELYFVDPQTDQILKKNDMFHVYGYEYAYFGKDVYIGRNNAEIIMPVYYHQIIGLNGQNYIYLR
jgi:hypothetical protein